MPSAPDFGDLYSAEGLTALNEHLQTRSYITGYHASADDASTFAYVWNTVDETQYPQVARWYNHIAALIGSGRLAKVVPAPAEDAGAEETEAPEEKKVEKSADDMLDDMFGDDDEEAEAEADRIRAQKAAEAASKKKDKPAVIAKSTVILDVKPMEDTTDLVELEKTIRQIVPEGLIWGACEKIPVAYGIKKLRILSTIVDDLVSVDDLQQSIEALEGVQSTDIYAFNKV